ncbi:MAG: tRNA (adenine(22)-N(1))-methyltransferase [Anaerovoracaceae bacterium]
MRSDERISAIAEEIGNEESVADIGTDHGYLGLLLKKRGLAGRVIMTDVSRGSLDKAVENAERLSPDEDFDFRLGDGLSVLKRGETDDVVIAGMGGLLISDILGADPELTCSFRKFILQPRNNCGRLRLFLRDSGFRIAGEKLAREGKRICEIIVCVPGEKRWESAVSDFERYESDPAFAAAADFPEELVLYSDPLLDEYLRMNIEKQQKIISGIEENAKEKGTAFDFAEARLAALEGLIKCRKKNSYEY